jgi:hypothetical protein
VKIEDHILVPVALDGDLDASDTTDLNRTLLNIGSHRHLCHEFAERRSQCRDIRAGLEPALAKDGVQLALLLFAHQHTVALTQVSCPHRMMVIPRHGFRALRNLAQFEQLETERFDLRKDAEHGGPIFKQAGEHGLADLQLSHHRGEGGQDGSSEPTPDPDRVQARRYGHAMIVQPDLVSRRRRNPVIVRDGPRATSAMFSGARLRGAAGRVRVAQPRSDRAPRAWSRYCGCAC